MTLIRLATRADAVAIADLEATALGPDAWSSNLIEQGLAGDLPTVAYLVAERADAVAGYAVVSCAGEIAELQRIAVVEAQRRTGLASALLAAARTHAQRHGAERLLLEVRVDNHGAQAFYAAGGFATLGVRQRYYRDGADAVILELVLGRQNVIHD